MWSEIRGDEKHYRFEGEAAVGKFFSGLVGGKSLGVPKRFRTLWDTRYSQGSEGSLTTASSRLGLEPRALALKAPTLLRNINAMTLRNRPMSDKYLHRLTMCTSSRGQTHACGAKKIQEVSSSHTGAMTSVKLRSSADTLPHVPVRLSHVR